jgi:hypothetical protein
MNRSLCNAIVATLIVGRAAFSAVLTVSGTDSVSDTYFRSDDKGGVYSAFTSMLIGTLPNGTVNNAGMLFDVSSASGQVVESAVLSIVFDKSWVNQTGDVAIEIHEISSANAGWDSSEANWNRRDNTPTWLAWAGGGNGCGVAGTDYAAVQIGQATAVDGAETGLLTFTLDASVVQKWVDNPSQNYGIVLIAPGASAGQVALVGTSESLNPPELQLTVVPTPTEIISFSGTNQVEDVLIRGDDTQGTAASNFGEYSLLIAGRLDASQPMNTLLRFADLDGLSGQFVSNATLRLYNYNHVGQTSDVTLDLYEVAAANGNWVEGTYENAVGWGASTWRFKVFNTVDWAGGRNGCGVAGTDYTTNLVGQALVADASAEWVEFELDPAVVQNWINNPDQNYGLILTSPNASVDGELAYFVSSEGTEGLGPQLVLEVSKAKTFETWIEAFSLSGDDAQETADPDGDSYNNLVEYALGGDPQDPAERGHSAVAGITESNGTNWFEIVHFERSDKEARGLSYTLEHIVDLGLTNWLSSGFAPVGTGAYDANFNMVTNRLDADAENSRFVRLLIGSE